MRLCGQLLTRKTRRFARDFHKRAVNLYMGNFKTSRSSAVFSFWGYE